MKEIWKDVFDYEGLYQISNLGNLKSLDRYVYTKKGYKIFVKGTLIKTRKNKQNSRQVNLSKDGEKTTHMLARLVYKAFNPDFDYYNNDLIIMHKDKNQDKNALDNLYMIDRHEIDIPYVISPMFIDNQFKKQPVMCITTNKKFDSIDKAEDFYNIKKNNGSISRCCQGKIKYSGKLEDGTKLVWQYLEKI
jgi:hypothetical protein